MNRLEIFTIELEDNGKLTLDNIQYIIQIFKNTNVLPNMYLGLLDNNYTLYILCDRESFNPSKEYENIKTTDLIRKMENIPLDMNLFLIEDYFFISRILDFIGSESHNYEAILAILNKDLERIKTREA